jgi:hypothetical protein
MSSEEDKCYICFENDDVMKICDCKYAHRGCANEDVMINRRTECEICGTKYPFLIPAIMIEFEREDELELELELEEVENINPILSTIMGYLLLIPNMFVTMLLFGGYNKIKSDNQIVIDNKCYEENYDKLRLSVALGYILLLLTMFISIVVLQNVLKKYVFKVLIMNSYVFIINVMVACSHVFGDIIVYNIDKINCKHIFALTYYNLPIGFICVLIASFLSMIYITIQYHFSVQYDIL